MHLKLKVDVHLPGIHFQIVCVHLAGPSTTSSVRWQDISVWADGTFSASETFIVHCDTVCDFCCTDSALYKFYVLVITIGVSVSWRFRVRRNRRTPPKLVQTSVNTAMTGQWFSTQNAPETIC